MYSYDHVIFLLQPVDVVDNIDFLNFYLAMLVLNCSTQGLCWVTWDLLLWLTGSAVVAVCSLRVQQLHSMWDLSSPIRD